MNPIRQVVNRLITNYAEKRLFGYGPADDWGYVDNLQTATKDVRLLGMYSGVAYRCINTISEAVAGQYVPFPYTTDAKGKKLTKPDHPFWAVLADPNPDMTFYQLIEGSASFVEQFGEFFWYVVGGTKTGYENGIKEIYLLRPDKMQIAVDKTTGSVIGYVYSAGNGAKKIHFDTEEIRHFMTFNPKNPYRGYSTVEASFDYIKTEEEVSRFTRNYFKNNAAMSGIINVSGKVPRESWNKFVRQWRERYQGTENAGKVALVRDSQITFTPVGSSVSDMQLTELKKDTVEQILMMFRIPKGMFGMESDQGLGRASVETLEYIFAKWTIDNKLDRFDDFIESILQDYYAKFGKYQISHENIIPADKEYVLRQQVAAVDVWMTREEIRESDPLLQNNKIKGANQLYTTLQQIPIEDPGATPATPAKPVPPADDPEDDPAEGGDGGADEDTEDASGKSAKITLVKAKAKKKQKKDLEYSVNQKEAFRQTLERNANAYSRQYRKGVIKVLKKQKATVLSNIQHLAGKSLADTLFNMSDEDAAFNSEIMPILAGLVLQQGQIALEFAGSDNKYQVSQSIMNALDKSTKRMAQNYNSETLDQLSASLVEGMQNNETISELSSRVSDVYAQAEGYRADRVARTESLGASNEATLDAYKQTGYVTAMKWFANPDACAYCGELDGTTVGLEETFVNQGDSVDVTNEDGSTSSYQADYSNVETPPLHPNCSCTIIPVTEVDG